MALFRIAHFNILLSIAVLVSACSAPRPDESSYVDDLRQSRAGKDAFLDSDPESPLPAERRAQFLPLSYYDPDPSYRIPATLVVADEPVFVDMPTSTGTIDQLQMVGHLEFYLDGESRTLSAFLSGAGDSLFVPFRDETSGEETYVAGRYLDIDLRSSGVYPLDFNLAYHPNCYFDEEFICPLPPPQNRLATAVRAGERLPRP